MEAYVKMSAVESTNYTVQQGKAAMPVTFVILQKLDKTW
jgi:hypothetical protein